MFSRLCSTSCFELEQTILRCHCRRNTWRSSSSSSHYGGNFILLVEEETGPLSTNVRSRCARSLIQVIKFRSTNVTIFLDSESSYSPFRRSMLMRNVEQSCHHCDGHMVQREGVMTMPTHSHGVLPSSAAQPPLDYLAFLVVPPAKMRNQVSVETGPDGAHLPAYST